MKSLKWRNAYLLFYERQTLDDVDEEDEECKKQQKNDFNDVVMQTVTSDSVEIDS
jgi:hypothetical protein